MLDSPTKRCSRCKEEKALDQFSGKSGYCRSCMSQYGKSYRAKLNGGEEKKKPELPLGYRACGYCGEMKHHLDFYKNESRCKSCLNGPIAAERRRKAGIVREEDWQDYRPNRSRTCECGRDKEMKADACDRCMLLDGRTRSERTIISALRIFGRPVATTEIGALVGWGWRHTRRILREHEGRLVRNTPEGWILTVKAED